MLGPQVARLLYPRFNHETRVFFCPDSQISLYDILCSLSICSVMAANPLAILFGSEARVKLLRFFLFNPSKEFTFDEISRRAKLVPTHTANR